MTVFPPVRPAVVRRLKPADLAWATELLGQALAEHPALEYVCRPLVMPRQRQWLLAQLLTYVLRHGAAYANGSGTAVVLWLGPTQPLWQPRLALPALWHLGWAGSRRLHRLVGTMAWLRRQSLAGPHHLLLGVAVHPAVRGRGEGRRLLASTLALRQSPLPCYFNGQVPSHLAYYQSLGFELAGHCPVGEGPNGPLTNWGFLRPATVFPKP
ncbi:GNAT family N-acetyltransferase [Hymenobacter sp. M29]|uniref:GNAT family N-acetyltransferase n=1 Tax=Hymenobacter mellowenesis TaxID=3063995 RepID=A0ABT9AL13_9BACT|nr:GNAT family N-acetyltransferase [Hymenobacter sp. M29]MDO7849891.1 GNAT family N-acetyltransferase [Hymenobacter sp. M29]